MITRSKARELFELIHKEKILKIENILDKKIKESVKKCHPCLQLEIKDTVEQAIYEYVATKHRYVFLDVSPTQFSISGWV